MTPARDFDKSKIPAALSILITVGFFVVLLGVLSGWLKIDDNQSVLILLGSLGAAWAAVVNYWFGSTAGSSRKTEIIAASPPTKGN